MFFPKELLRLFGLNKAIDARIDKTKTGKSGRKFVEKSHIVLTIIYTIIF